MGQQRPNQAGTVGMAVWPCMAIDTLTFAAWLTNLVDPNYDRRRRSKVCSKVRKSLILPVRRSATKICRPNVSKRNSEVEVVIQWLSPRAVEFLAQFSAQKKTHFGFDALSGQGFGSNTNGQSRAEWMSEPRHICS